MIAISFSPIYEDRVSIYLKNSNIKKHGVTYDYKETPQGLDESKCYWLFDYKHGKLVNALLSELVDMKHIMGIDDLEFSYVNQEKEFYTQYTNQFGSVKWFKV